MDSTGAERGAKVGVRLGCSRVWYVAVRVESEVRVRGVKSVGSILEARDLSTRVRSLVLVRGSVVKDQMVAGERSYGLVRPHHSTRKSIFLIVSLIGSVVGGASLEPLWLLRAGCDRERFRACSVLVQQV